MVFSKCCARRGTAKDAIKDEWCWAIIWKRFLWQRGNETQVYNVSRKASRMERWSGAVRVPGSGKYSFECWKWIAGRDSLQGGGPGGETEEEEGEGGREDVVGEVRWVEEMRVAAPFFTADKNICWDINLELRSSLPLLPHHPSSFCANYYLGTCTSLLHPATTHTHTRTNLAFYPIQSYILGSPHSLTAFHKACKRLFTGCRKPWPAGDPCLKGKYKAALKDSTCMAEVYKAGLSRCHIGHLS